MECLALGLHPLLYIYYLCQMKNGNAIVMSGIRPTGFLHLGNYFGAMRNYVKLQEEYTCYFMVADLHALTTHPDTKELKENVHRVLADLKRQPPSKTRQGYNLITSMQVC